MTATLVLLTVSEGEPSPPGRPRPGPEEWDGADQGARRLGRPPRTGRFWTCGRKPVGAQRWLRLLTAVVGAGLGLGFVSLGWLADLCLRQGRVITELEARVASLPRATEAGPDK